MHNHCQRTHKESNKPEASIDWSLQDNTMHTRKNCTTCDHSAFRLRHAILVIVDLKLMNHVYYNKDCPAWMRNCHKSCNFPACAWCYLASNIYQCLLLQVCRFGLMLCVFFDNDCGCVPDGMRNNRNLWRIFVLGNNPSSHGSFYLREFITHNQRLCF